MTTRPSSHRAPWAHRPPGNQAVRGVDVAVSTGTAKFVDDHTISVTTDQGTTTRIHGDKFVIGVGTKPARPSTVEFVGETIVDSDQILGMDKVPASMSWSVPG